MARQLSKEFQFLQDQGVELAQRYAGQYVALIGAQVAGVGATAQEAYEQARQKYPTGEPLLKYFPPVDAALVL